MTKPIAITQGDAAGIGLETVVKAFLQEPELTRGSFVVGDLASVRRAVELVCRGGLVLPIAELNDLSAVARCPPACLPLWAMPSEAQGQAPDWGEVSARAGRMAGDCVMWAARAALSGQVAAIVTAPLNKASLSLAGPPYSAFAGHTEMLQAESARHLGLAVSQCPVRMMLANDEIRVVLVSIHVALREALELITVDRVLETLLITHKALQLTLGRSPRIALAGLNPHAGEGGLFGREEIDLLMPAVSAARASGLNVSDPQPPDTVFMRARRLNVQDPEFDVVVALYHDQGLIPVKYLGIDKGVNVTLGLPLVRTSPDHGTAFDIAGKGIADPGSLIQALNMARQLA